MVRGIARKKLVTLAAVWLLAAVAFASDEFPWIKEFHGVQVVNAAERRKNWQKNAINWAKAEKLGDGILYVPAVMDERGGWPRRMYCHFARIDTKAKNVRFTGMDRCEDWCKKRIVGRPTEWRYTLKEPTSDFIARFRGDKAKGGKGRDMRLAYNATGWGPFPGLATNYWANINSPFYADGIQVGAHPAGGGVSYPGVGALVIWKDGTAEIADELTEADEKRIWVCQPGFKTRLVRDGQSVIRDDGEKFNASVRPRTAVGLSKDRQYVYVLVVDGDGGTAWSAGAEMSTVAKLMLKAEAYQAINCDGGGSSNMVAWDDKRKCPRVMGRPSKGFGYGGQRFGASHVGVYLAPTIAKIGTYNYDDWDCVLADARDGETPDGAKAVDVLADLKIETPERVPEGLGLRLVDGVTLTVGAGVRATVKGAYGKVTVETADAEGFVLGGGLAGIVRVRCAAAKRAGAAFGTSTLTLEKARAQVGKIRCEGNGALAATAEGTDGAVTLTWKMVK